MGFIFTKTCAASLIITGLTGCIGLDFGFSGGPSLGISGFDHFGDRTEPEFNSFRLSYDNWLGFSRDLTITIDNAFSRIQAGDQNAIKLAANFVRPGYEVLSRKYGIRLPSSSPVARPAIQRFIFETDLSNWAIVNDYGDAPIRNALMESDESLQARWRGRILNSYIEFNSLRPRRLDIHFELEVQVQSKSPGDQEWKYAKLDQTKVNEIASSMRRDLIARYRDYFKNDLGIDVTSPGFPSFHED